MATTIETDLKDILTKIDNRLDRIENDLTEIKINQSETRGEIKVLDEKITGIGKRLENQEFIGRSIFVGVILALLAGAVKLFGFPPNRRSRNVTGRSRQTHLSLIDIRQNFNGFLTKRPMKRAVTGKNAAPLIHIPSVIKEAIAIKIGKFSPRFR